MKAPENRYYGNRKKRVRDEIPLSSYLSSLGISSDEFKQLTQEEENYVKHMIEESKQFTKQQRMKEIRNEVDIENLRSIISEYMSCFLIIGYDCDDKRILIKNTSTDKEDDAILEELRLIFFKLMGGNQ